MTSQAIPPHSAKPVGSDDKNEKITYVKLMGIEKSQETVDELTKEAVNALGVFDGDTSFLEKLAYKLALRKKITGLRGKFFL